MIQNSHNTTSRKASARRSDGCDGTTRYRTIRDGVWKASARSDDSYDGCDRIITEGGRPESTARRSEQNSQQSERKPRPISTHCSIRPGAKSEN